MQAGFVLLGAGLGRVMLKWLVIVLIAQCTINVMLVFAQVLVAFLCRAKQTPKSKQQPSATLVTAGGTAAHGFGKTPDFSSPPATELQLERRK
jgi:hypothetical protein